MISNILWILFLGFLIWWIFFARKFEIVDDEFRCYPDADIKLPIRSDFGSVGHDFFAPCDIHLKPGEKKLIFTDIRAKFPFFEGLYLIIRSSLAVKLGLMLTNNIGLVDSTYYRNKGNDGNIGIALVNTTSRPVTIKEGDRVMQGVFLLSLTVLSSYMKRKRIEGFGSSGK